MIRGGTLERRRRTQTDRKRGGRRMGSGEGVGAELT